MRSRTSRFYKGFTLVELLVVVLILSILMAVALPLYLSAVIDAKKKTCRANLQTISNTVFAAKVKSSSPDYSGWNGNTVASLVAQTPDKVPDITTAPVCPAGGAYSIAAGASGDNTTFKVVCSVSTHGTFQPGLDSN